MTLPQTHPRFTLNFDLLGHRRSPIAKLMLVTAALCAFGVVTGCKPERNVEAATVSSVSQATTSVVEAPPSVQANSEVVAPSPRSDQTATKAIVRRAQPEDREASKPVNIAGGWVNAGGACDSGASVFFNTDGTYMSEGEKGTWNLSGKTLTVTTAVTFDEGAATSPEPQDATADITEKAVLTLLSVTDDAASVVLSNGSNANWTRCNS